jgi:phytoene dehydrogenase-like protein
MALPPLMTTATMTTGHWRDQADCGREDAMTDAIVVGAGPNGLAAAVALAKAGVEVTVLEAADEIGGGTRSGEAIVPGLLHDHCSAIHPMAVGSPFLTGLGLDSYGLAWRLPDIDCVHPLDDGSAGVLHRSVETTADGLGADGRRWRRLFGTTSAGFDALAQDIMGPLLHVPHHPLTLARFGAPTVLPASTLARWLRTPQARALFGGVAAHAFRPLHYPMTSAIGLGILTAGHRYGWPVAAGGSQSITNALAALLADLGGKVETGTRIEAASQIPPADVTMFDLAPEAVAGILGDRLPSRVARAYGGFRQGPGAFKVDFAVEGGVPWTNRSARRAGTVHVVGSYAELATAERDVHAGRMPARPFVLVGQQYLADPQRSVGDIHPVWTYAHVPNGFSGDATEAIIAQIERFAPGFRDRIVGMTVRSTIQMSSYNPNYVGGDIMTGSKDIRQLTFGPRITLSPYKVGIPGMYMCSAATPPGPGAHGMCGANAAGVALSELV